MAEFLRSVAPCLVLATFVACTGKDPYNPGSSLGTFHVAAKLGGASCGPAPDPWEFDVRLSQEGSTLYWIQGGAPVAGQVDAKNHVLLTSTSEHTVRAADVRTKSTGCVLLREDALDVVLTQTRETSDVDHGLAATTGFGGTLTYGFTPHASSDCAAEVSAFGGDFATLPCDVTYAVTGARAAATSR